MKFSYKIYSSLFMLFSIMTFGQEVPKIFPPSPEASSLTKFVDMPVSLYNGTPNISIPIYTVSSGSIQVPISLSYHAKGIQVSEKASHVGLGWALEAGGVVSRQIRGFADESLYGYINDDYIQNFVTDSNVKAELCGMDSNDELDYYADLFHFSFMGYSGKFIFDHVTKEPVLQTKSDVKIERVSGDGNYFHRFIITTPDGTKYYFGGVNNPVDAKDKPSSMQNYLYTDDSNGYQSLGNSSSYNFVNAWYLVKVETVKNEIVEFVYEQEQVFYTDVDKVETTDYIDRINDPSITNHEIKDKVKSVYYSKTTIYQNQIKEIIFNNGKVKFNNIVSRQDLQGAKALDNIEIVDKNAIVKKKVNFTYFYTTSDDVNLPTVLGILDLENNPETMYARKRLFLQKVEEVNLVDNVKISTQLEYNPIILPNRNSNAKDNWGYFNGKSNDFIKVFYGADRKIDEIKSEAGILKKMIHPTGGYTEFVYEHNKVVPPSFFGSLMIAHNNPTATKTVGLFKNYNLYNTSTNRYVKLFEIKHTRTSLNFEVIFDDTNCEANGTAQPGCMYDIFLTQTNGTVICRLTLGTHSNIVLYPGEYFIQVIPRGAHHPNEFEGYEDEEFMINGNWQEQIIPENYELFAAGKRIKKIIKGDSNGVLLEKEFLYTDDNGKSSGKTFSIPPFYDIIFEVNGAYCVGTESLGVTSPISNFSGNELGYSKVTEIQKGSGNVGKTVHTFTNFENTGLYYKFPYNIPNDFGWTRGMPLNTKYYSYKNGSYNLEKEVSNTYNCYGSISLTENTTTLIDPYVSDYVVNNNITKIPFYRFPKIPSFLQVPKYYMDCNNHKTAFFYGGKLFLSKSIEKNYFSTGTITTENNFEYSSANHQQLTKESTINSTGETIDTQYFYSKDSAMSGKPFASALVGKNIIVPLVTQTFKNTTSLLNTKETEYGSFTSNVVNQPMYLPKYVKIKKGDEVAIPLEKKITSDYDKNGNIIQYTLENGIPVSIIWGYNNSQPIAKLENVTFTSISTSDITNLQSLSSTGTEANLITALNALRTSFPNAMITTFTYIPLVGASTITDPKGDKITYHYDKFNRLEFVKDKNGNILSENQYHYKN